MKNQHQPRSLYMQRCESEAMWFYYVEGYLMNKSSRYLGSVHNSSATVSSSLSI